MRWIESVAVIAVVLASATAHADTIYVCWDGSGDYVTIQEGINAASDGDQVIVCDGTYTGYGNRDLDFGGRLITLRSENGPDTCIIDCEGDPNNPHHGFYFNSGETPDAVVEGFTITNGWAEYGGGVACAWGNPTIANCTIAGNWASGGGGVLCVGSPGATLSNCTISGNSAEAGGGVCCMFSGDPVITNCTITGNSAGHGGAVYCFGDDAPCDPTLTNCTITGNSASYGGGVFCHWMYANPTLTNCTITGNSASYGGGVYCGQEARATINNCILWADEPAEIWGPALVSYSDVQGGWPGTGNIDADPLFVDPDGPDDDPNTWEDNDFHLSAGSPCIDAADNEAVPPDELDLNEDGDTTEPIPFDLDGNRRFADDPCTDDTGNPDPDYPDLPIVDMGAYEYQPCIGDVDCDGDTDHADLGAFLSAWGWQPGDPNWNPNADLDGDGDVDLGDLAILLTDWGCGT